MTPVYIWTDLFGAPRLVGATTIENGQGIFRYANDYLAEGLPALDPLNLPTRDEEFRTRANGGLFGVLADAGPDAWGRRVLTALHPRRMATAGPLEVLLMSSGHGAGALLFSGSRDRAEGRGASLALKDLGAAAEAAQEVEAGAVLREQLRQLLAMSSALGGVHPKVAVTDDGEWIAKFASREDVIATPRVEWATMELARACGIGAAEVRLVALAERPALLVRRFDRGPLRHYASAHALWNRARAREEDAQDWASYAGLVELRRHLPGDEVRRDIEEVFRRLVFNVLVGNTDDHGRNHGFLMDAAGNWRLAPAFDVLPAVGASAELQALGAGPAGRERSIENVLAGCSGFGVRRPQAVQIVRKMQMCVRGRFPELLDRAGVVPTQREAVLARML